jgi:hypothetical protein
LRQYEVDLGDDSPRQVTAAPVKLIEPILGVGDAWAVIGAADERWSGGVGAWASLYADEQDASEQ